MSWLIILLLVSSIAERAATQVRQFVPVNKSVVPQELLDSESLCGDPGTTAESVKDCEQDFKRIGRVWAGDVNDDGVQELVVYPGTAWSGSGGDSYLLFQKRGHSWVPLFPSSSDWFTLAPRFDILPSKHSGYHDLRIAEDWCAKWDGKNYVNYNDADYHHLSPSFFDSSWTEAGIFWAIHYQGLKQFRFSPQWFPDFSDGSSKNVVLKDSQDDLQWIAFFKGGIWGVRGATAFLLLPCPSYRGSEQMEFNGDWLVIHGEDDGASEGAPVVARYNRRTHEMVILQNVTQ